MHVTRRELALRTGTPPCCRACGEPATLTCPRCNTFRYCSQACLHLHCAAPRAVTPPTHAPGHATPAAALCAAVRVARTALHGLHTPHSARSIRLPCAARSKSRHAAPLIAKLPDHSPFKASKASVPYHRLADAVSALAATVHPSAQPAAQHHLQLHLMARPCPCARLAPHMHA